MIVTVPSATPFTTPLLLTVAMLGSLLSHLTVLFVGLPLSCAFSVTVLPVTTCFAPLMAMPVAPLACAVTLQEADRSEPSVVLAVITAVPFAATQVIVPSASTFATFSLLLSQISALFVASSGSTVTCSVSTVCPLPR